MALIDSLPMRTPPLVSRLTTTSRGHEHNRREVVGAPRAAGQPASRGRILLSRLRQAGGGRLLGADRAPPQTPLRRLQGLRRSDRPLLRGDLRDAGRGHADGQHLRRRRPELVADRPRYGARSGARRPTGDRLGRQPGARLPLRRGRGRGLLAVAASLADPDFRGRAWKSASTGPSPCSSWCGR